VVMVGSDGEAETPKLSHPLLSGLGVCFDVGQANALVALKYTVSVW